MSAYLLNWNPKRFPWLDLEDEIAYLNADGWIESRWSSGVTKSIRVGDRFFLMRLGTPPKGIVGSGWCISVPYEAPHWDEQFEGESRHALFVDIIFDALLNAEFDRIFELDALRSDSLLGRMNWLSQASGVRIPDDIAAELQVRWSEFLSVELPSPQEVESGYFEGTVKSVTLTTYERSLTARRLCIKHHGARCAVCGFDFAKVYGPIGEGYIHVHHILPLASIGQEYQVDPVTDLIPVCPNCHAVIHRRTPCYTIEEIKSFLHRSPVGAIED